MGSVKSLKRICCSVICFFDCSSACLTLTKRVQLTKKPLGIEVNVVENGTNVDTLPSNGSPSPALVSAMREGFAQLSGDMANAISEAFKSFKAELEVSYGDEEDNFLQSDDDHEVNKPPTKKHSEVKSAEDKSKKILDIDASVGQLLEQSNTSSNEGKSNPKEGKSKVLSSFKLDLQKEEKGPDMDTEPASIVKTLIKDGLPEEKLQDKMNKYHRPGNCENLTKVQVNQAVWDNLSPSVQSHDIKMQKVQTSLFKGMCALTSMINRLLDQIPSLPVGNELLQQVTDAFAFIANANIELNQRWRELIKPDLHNDYKYLCSSSPTIMDQLFGDDLPKQVKDLMEVNCVGKKVTTHSGSSRSSFDSGSSRNYTPYNSSCG